MPGGSDGASYSPEALVATVRVRPVSALTSVTDAPGMAAPLASCTEPRIVPLTAWANSPPGSRTSSTHAVGRKCRSDLKRFPPPPGVISQNFAVVGGLLSILIVREQDLSACARFGGFAHRRRLWLRPSRYSPLSIFSIASVNRPE